MCVILDTNRFSEALGKARDPRYVPLLEWVLSGRGLLVYGGTKYDTEIDGVQVARTFFAQRLRAGQAFLASKADVDAEEAKIAAMPHDSDDEHILALARVTGARTVCTEDADLMSDFKNTKLVPPPRGRVYRAAAHCALLQHDACCQRPPPTRKRAGHSKATKKAKKRR